MNFFVLFFCCLSKIFLGEVCVNTCRRKYCVSKIDKISFLFCFSYDSLTSPKNKNDSLWTLIFRLMIFRFHIHFELHLYQSNIYIYGFEQSSFFIYWSHIKKKEIMKKMKRADKHRNARSKVNSIHN
jgi:hypothetical protein